MQGNLMSCCIISMRSDTDVRWICPLSHQLTQTIRINTSCQVALERNIWKMLKLTNVFAESESNGSYVLKKLSENKSQHLERSDVWEVKTLLVNLSQTRSYSGAFPLLFWTLTISHKCTNIPSPFVSLKQLLVLIFTFSQKRFWIHQIAFDSVLKIILRESWEENLLSQKLKVQF